MEEISNEYVGQMIREVREQRGLQQKELAEKIGEQPPTLSKIETGRQEASIQILVNISKELDVRLEYLLGMDKDMDDDTHIVNLLMKKFLRIITAQNILKNKRVFASEDFEDFFWSVSGQYIVLEGPKRNFSFMKRVAIANGKGKVEQDTLIKEAFDKYKQEADEKVVDKCFLRSKNEMQNLVQEYVKWEKARVEET